MKKFRKIWLLFVAFMTAIFILYWGLQMIKTDSSGPVISGGGDRIEVSIHDGEEVLLKGITASDKKDGDVTDSLLVESISTFYDDTRVVTCVAFDSDNHISKVQREIVYTDYTSPRFALNGSLRFRAGEKINIDTIVSAMDCLDGDLSRKIKVNTDAAINNRVTGLYTITYEVSNSAGDQVRLPIDIEIYEPYNNEVQLELSKYLVYYEGREINYKNFLKSVTKGNLEYSFSADPSRKDLVRVDAQVNTQKPGVYPVYYYYTETYSNYTSEAKEVLYVVVE